MKADLAICLEVAEHLSKERADTFVREVTQLSDVVLFGAAIEGQTGDKHINCQMQSYWVEKFRLLGYEPIDLIRNAFWDNKMRFYM